MRLRDVELRDLPAYLAMRCDPVMMAELGGPLPAEGMAAKVARDVAAAAADRDWIKVIEVDGQPAGTVVLWTHPEASAESHPNQPAVAPLSEIGWMVLPDFQGRGLAKAAVRELLEQACADGRWGRVHAYPGVGNGASNGICRSLGFTLRAECEVDFAGRTLRCNDWAYDTVGVRHQ
ncbi:GNAT family N-acetyltransferase [Kitasatospora sp. NPDC006697]|uniref:GNAT family N-acetyltransferase n=1 Tax=Kitasatospora sp. NPDC006697 TaxID=3364020 RepID=UPI0036C03138